MKLAACIGGGAVLGIAAAVGFFYWVMTDGFKNWGP